MWSSISCISNMYDRKKYLSLCFFSSLLEGCISWVFFWLFCVSLIFFVRRYSDPLRVADFNLAVDHQCLHRHSTSPNSYAFVSSSSSCVCRFRFKHVKCFLSFIYKSIERSKSIISDPDNCAWTSGQLDSWTACKHWLENLNGFQLRKRKFFLRDLPRTSELVKVYFIVFCNSQTNAGSN